MNAKVPTRAALVLCLALLTGLTALAPITRAQSSSAPSLRLFTAARSATLERFGRRLSLDLGAWVSTRGGAFEVRVWRSDYDSPIQAAQFDAVGGEQLRAIPARALNGWRGFTDLLRLQMTDRSGTVVLSRRFGFCPNNFDRQRVNDQGPVDSTYPFSCKGGRSPFTKGMVWGIDDHWAVNASPRLIKAPARSLPDGVYTATISITPRFTRLFGIAAAQSTATVRATVHTSGGCCAARSATARANAVPGSGQAAPQRDVPTVTDPDPGTLPDLVSLPAWNIHSFTSRRGRDLLVFAATEWNAGPSKLVVEGFRRQGRNTMRAFQYFRDAQGEVVGRAPVGTMDFDARHGHGHWHFEQFVRYTLLDTSRQRVVASHKQSFCLAPTDAIDLTVPGAEWALDQFGFGSFCGSQSSIWVREEMPTGWGDTYFQFVAGQAFNITNVPNGRYFIRVKVNPTGALFERDTSNNSELRAIRLRGRAGHRTVVVRPWHGIQR